MEKRVWFDGLVAQTEVPRLLKQHEFIRNLMLDGHWWTLREISNATGYPEASISAQLRHLRKERFGSWVIEKRRRTDQGLWEYSLRNPNSPTQLQLLEESHA